MDCLDREENTNSSAKTNQLKNQQVWNIWPTPYSRRTNTSKSKSKNQKIMQKMSDFNRTSILPKSIKKAFSDVHTYNFSNLLNTKFHPMKKQSLYSKDKYNHNMTKTVKRKDFYVDPNRLQLDEYMLKQIKKNKHSVKALNKEVYGLKREVKKLQDQHDDYLLLEKTKTQDHSQSHVTIHRKNNRVAFTDRQSKASCHSKHNIKSKDNSILSISSSVSSSKNSSLSSMKKSKNSETTSRQKLSKKIQQLKARASLEQREKKKLKKQIEQKIKRACQKVEKKHIETPTRDHQQKSESLSADYQKLLELLQTSKSISSPKRESAASTQKTVDIQQIEKKDDILTKYTQEQKPVMPQTYEENNKNTEVQGNHYFQSIFSETKMEKIQSNPHSDTNLLQSSPSRFQIDSPKPKKKLQMSRCIELRVENEPAQSSSGSGFDGLFAGPVQVRSGPIDMSFQGGDSDKRRLRQLEFEFDQLVRQQLIASDPQEKDMLGQTIRSVLWSITQLKGKLEKESS